MSVNREIHKEENLEGRNRASSIVKLKRREALVARRGVWPGIIWARDRF